MTVKEVCRLTGISVRTLHYYDEINLVKPEFTDPQTRYRHYFDRNIEELMWILELKEYGFSLDSIKEILANEERDLMSAYKNRYYEMLRESEKIQAVLKKLALKIKQNQEGVYMNKKILLVDDAAFMRMMTKDIFTKNGYEVVGEAANGFEAIEEYKKSSPDLVLMDIVMPEMDGINALKKIKETNAGVAVVMLSAMGQPGMVVESLRYGAAGFVVKPFQAETVLKAADSAVNSDRDFDVGKLEKLSEKLSHVSSEKNKILMQTQIDEFIDNVSNDGDNGKSISVDEIIRKMYDGGISEPIIDSPPTQNRVEELLSKVVQGQEEMLKMMQKLVDKD